MQQQKGERMIRNDDLILADGQYYSLDCHKTQLNNNVLVVGTSGSGKTRSIVTPNLLQASGSYVVSDPKGNLYKKYGGYLKEQGYVVKKLDFVHPDRSVHYNPFHYIHSEQDIIKIAHLMIGDVREGSKEDPYWKQTAETLLTSVISYLMSYTSVKYRNMSNLMKLILACQPQDDDFKSKTAYDDIMAGVESENPNAFTLRQYKKYRMAPARTLMCTLSTATARLGMYESRELCKMLEDDTLEITDIGKRKTALFVVVSDTDRSMDTLVNIFFTQAMNELCSYADDRCRDNCLPVPVRFIMDDFATNCMIDEFPRMISSIRSRGISTMLMIQAESQLEAAYGRDGDTIIGNCDTYVYLGGNDVKTAKAVSMRCDLPLKKILNMPVGTNWIFRRGQEPVNASNFNLDNYRSLRYGEKLPEQKNLVL